MEEDKNRGRVICVAANQEVAKDLITSLSKEGYKISYLINMAPEKMQGITDYYDLSEFAKARGMDLIRPKTYSMEDEATREIFDDLKIDMIIVIGWQRLIPEWLLDKLSIGAFGMHGSSEPLPKGRGRSPMNWSLIENKNKFITHLLRYNKDADSGKIIASQEFAIEEKDTIKDLMYKNQVAQTQLLLQYFPLILSRIVKYKEQPKDVEASYYPKRTPEDGVIDWNWTTRQLFNLVRAVTKPYPGAFTFSDGKKVMIWDACAFDSKVYSEFKMGEILEVFADKSFVVKTKDGSLLVKSYEADYFIPEKGMELESRENASFDKLKEMKGENLSFNKKGYRKILDAAKAANYSIIPFKECETIQDKKFIILRHDIDFSLQFALELAKLEAELGIFSTYFTRARNEFYDPFSEQGKAIVREIFELGHEIGFHWDSRDYSSDADEGKKKFLEDKEKIEAVINKKIISVSQHNPSSTPLIDVSPFVKIDAYDKMFSNHDLIYVSESLAAWRQYTPLDLIKKEKNFHFLAHPLWWIAEGNTMKEKLEFFAGMNESLKEEVSRFHDEAKEMLEHREERDREYQKLRQVI